MVIAIAAGIDEARTVHSLNTYYYSPLKPQMRVDFCVESLKCAIRSDFDGYRGV